jgi:MFS family permease
MVYGLSLAGVAYLEEQTGSSAGTGLVILSSILPAFLASLVGGAAVDRFGRRPTLLVSHLSRALLGLGFWAGTRFLSPGAALAAIALVNVGTAVFGQFAFPAELSLVPDLVHRDQVPRANALLQFGMLLGEGLGIIFLTPVLVRLFGVPLVGLSGALLCLAALLLVLGLPAESRSEAERAESRSEAERNDSPAPGPQARSGLTWADLKAGWKAIATDPLLRLVVLQATVGATVLLVLLSLVPGLATRHLGLAVADAPFLILPGGLTFVLAAVVVSRRQAWLSPPAWIAAGLLVLGLGTGLLGVAAMVESGTGLALAGIVGIGLGLGAVIIPGRVVLQQRPPQELRARVIAGQLSLANAAAVIPLLVGGSLADRWGLGPVMIALAAIAVVAGFAGIGRLRRARSASLDAPAQRAPGGQEARSPGAQRSERPEGPAADQ